MAKGAKVFRVLFSVVSFFDRAEKSWTIFAASIGARVGLEMSLMSRTGDASAHVERRSGRMFVKCILIGAVILLLCEI